MSKQTAAAEQQPETQQDQGSEVQVVDHRDQGGDVMEVRPIDRFKRALTLSAPTIMKMLPAHVPLEKFQAMVVTAVAYNAKLLECSTTSLLRATLDAAELGLSLNPNLKEGDILPVWSKDGSVAQFRPRYTGLMKLARQSGAVKDIYAHEVYENDEFYYEYGLDQKLVHRPAQKGDRGALTFAYVVWTSPDGIKGFEVVDKKRIDRAKNASEGHKAFKKGLIKSTPWDTDEGEMWRKTAVRAGSKYMPQSTDSDKFARALALDSQDIKFDDEPVAQIADEARPKIEGPRPTRESTKAEAEAARKEDQQRTAQFRQTVQDGDDRPEPPAAEEPVVQEPAQDAKKADPAKTAGVPTDPPALLKFLMSKLVKAGSEQMLNAICQDYAVEIQILQQKAPKLHDELMEGIDGKRAAMKKR